MWNDEDSFYLEHITFIEYWTYLHPSKLSMVQTTCAINAGKIYLYMCRKAKRDQLTEGSVRERNEW